MATEWAPVNAPPAPLRVAILNDYEVVVAGLAALLSSQDPRIRVIELDSRVPAISDVDIVLLDTFAFASGGLVDLAALVRHARRREARVVVFSWVTDPASVRRAMADGASGHLWKGLSSRELVEALDAIRAGVVTVRGPSRTQADVGSVTPATQGSELARWPGQDWGLSTREAEVLALVAKGMSNQETAEQLYLGINTVKTYIRTAYRKIGVTSRTQAVLWAVDNGFDMQTARVLYDDDGFPGPDPAGREPVRTRPVRPPSSSQRDQTVPPVSSVVRELGRRAEETRTLVPDLIGLTLASTQDDVPFTVASTSDRVAALDGVQYLGDGPCVRAAATRRALACNRAELDQEPTWRAFAAATAAAGVASTLSVPLVHRGRVVGTINVYGAVENAFLGRLGDLEALYRDWAPVNAEGATLPRRRPQVEAMSQHLRDDLDIKAATNQTASLEGVPLHRARQRLADAAHRAGVSQAHLATTILGIPPR